MSQLNSAAVDAMEKLTQNIRLRSLFAVCTGVLASWCEELGRLLLARHQNSRSAAVTSVDCVSTQKQVAGYVSIP